MPRLAPHMVSKARTLRSDATTEERLLWAQLRHIRPRFTRQLPIGRYIVDFACRPLRIAIEIDGSQHLDAAAYDQERTAFLEELGWCVLRFWNHEVVENFDGVVEAIAAALQKKTLTQPSPAKAREG